MSDGATGAVALTDIKVDGDKYTVSQSSNPDIVTITIGDQKTVTGIHTYRVSDKLKIGDDSNNTFDEVYAIIIGSD